jgi:hypothetical protein
MDGGLEALLEVSKALLDLFSGSFRYNGKTELVQISIRIYAVRGKNRCVTIGSWWIGFLMI